jgi:hypothetical protein
MKKLFCILLALFTLHISKAQLVSQLSLQPNPTASLSAWAGSPQILTLLVTNIGPNGTPSKDYKIKTTIKTTSGDAVAVTDLSKAPTLNSIASSTVAHNAAIVLPLQFMQFSGSYQGTMLRTGKLPVGTYQLCVQLVNALDYAVIAPEQCRIFNIASLQLPFLVSPAPLSSIDKNIAQSVITFRWTPLVPRPQQQIISYHIQVFEVLENQKPMQAFRSNLPLLDKVVLGTTQYIWQPQLSFNEIIVEKDSSFAASDSAVLTTEIVKTFIWTVQTFTRDAAGGKEEPVTEGSVNGDGRSEPQVFYVRKIKPRKMSGN